MKILYDTKPPREFDSLLVVLAALGLTTVAPPDGSCPIPKGMNEAGLSPKAMSVAFD